MSQLSVTLQRTAAVLLWLAGSFLFIRWLMVPLLPFLLALGLSAMVEPAVGRVRRLLRVRRSFAAALVTTAALLVFGGGAAAVLVPLALELGQGQSACRRRWRRSRRSGTAFWTGWGTGTPRRPPSCAPPWTLWRSG